MKGIPAIYLGRHVDKESFRTNVYGPTGEKKLVESWDAYEAAMQSGLWFATRESAIENESDLTTKSKSKTKQKPRSKPVKVEEFEQVDEMPADELDDMVFEVKDGQ